MDPLSVTASVVGLLAAAGKVASVLSRMKSNVSEAPRSIEQTLFHVKELQACFAAVHKFIVGANSVTPASQRRLSMIEVDQLVATLTESVLTFSELEVLVTPFEECPQASIRNRIKWAWKDDVVSRIIVRLDRHKSSLSLMLNIVQCESDLEAEKSQQSLLILVQQLVESNVEISRRLRTLETTFETESINTACFRNGNAVETGESEEAIMDQPPKTSQQTTLMSFEKSSTSFPSIFSYSPFEDDLNDSRVYKRTQPYECDVSFTSSAVRSHSWSVFSGLSLSQISSISVIALPVYSHEISNKEWYGFVFSDQPDSQGKPILAAIDEEIQEVEGMEQEIHSCIGIYDNVTNPVLDDSIRASSWVPQVTIEGQIFYYNTETGEISMEYPLKRATTMIHSKARDSLNINIQANLGPLSSMVRNNTDDEYHESDGRFVAEKDRGRVILDLTGPRPTNTGASTDLISQPIEIDISKIQPNVPSPVTSELLGEMDIYKLVLLGDNDVGKTGLTTQLCLGHFVEFYDPTVEDSYRKEVVIDGQRCILEFLDMQYQEQYTALRDQWIRDGEGFLLVYSITNRSSFSRVHRFHRQIQRVKQISDPFTYPGSPFVHKHESPPIMLVGNNCDEDTEREVSLLEGYNLARELGCNFVETSSRNGTNVEKAFYAVVRHLRRQRIEAREQMLTMGRESSQGRYASRQHRRSQKKARGVSQAWQRVRSRAS